MLDFDKKYQEMAKRVNTGFLIKELQEGFYRSKNLDPDRIAEDILVLYLSDKWRAREYPDTGLEPKYFDNFKSFVEHVPPDGLGVRWNKLKRICADTVAQRIFQIEVPTLNPVGNPHGKLRNAKIKESETTDYKLGRLKRDRPELAQQVVDGQLSANAAYIQAGFAPKKKTVPLIAEKVVDFIKKEFNLTEIAYIKEHL